MRLAHLAVIARSQHNRRIFQVEVCHAILNLSGIGDPYAEEDGSDEEGSEASEASTLLQAAEDTMQSHMASNGIGPNEAQASCE